MDPVTTAIVAAITAGVASGLPKVAENAIADSYEALKNLIKEKFGKKSKVVKAVDRLEEKPESDGRKLILQGEVADAKVDQDPEILKVVQSLLKLIESQPNGGRFIQQATGNYIAQAGPGATATVKVNQPDEE